MKAEQYLERIKKIDAMIKNKLRDRARWIEVSQSLGGASDGDRVLSSPNPHRGADAIGNYVDLEREIDALKEERVEIIKNIERLPVEEYDVIYKLYVEDYTRKELAYHYGKSIDWVKERKKRGLLLIQSMLDKQTYTESG